MKTVVTKNIDGHKIIVGFGTLAMDPEATRKIVKAEITKTYEFMSVVEKKSQYRSMVGLADECVKKSKNTRNAAEKEKFHRDKSGFLERANGHMEELRELATPLKEKEKSLLTEHAVYFEPKPGEYRKTAARIGALRALVADNKGTALVDVDGKLIDDNRGITYFQKISSGWKVVEVFALGVRIPKSSLLYADLDEGQRKEVDLQIEKNAVGKMRQPEKIQSRQNAEKVAEHNAAGLRSRLEIKGETDALEQAKKFYSSRMDEIAAIYE